MYLSTIFGAWLADRVLGAEKTLFVSGVVVMLRHIALATLPGLMGLFIGLSLIVLGSGGHGAGAEHLRQQTRRAATHATA